MTPPKLARSLDVSFGGAAGTLSYERRGRPRRSSVLGGGRREERAVQPDGGGVGAAAVCWAGSVSDSKIRIRPGMPI